MTIIEPAIMQRLQPVTFNLYRDVHKGIRSELFAVVGEAGRVDPSDNVGAASLVDQVRQVVQLLVEHAEHEDGTIQPALELHAPMLAEQVAEDHNTLEERMDWLVAFGSDALAAGPRGVFLHELYVELAAFTGAYLAHQDFEERQVIQALESALGPEGVLGLHMEILGKMRPEQMIRGLAVMFPAMNIDDRTELLGGMRATAPADAFNGVWGLAKSVLSPDDSRAVAVRLGLA